MLKKILTLIIILQTSGLLHAQQFVAFPLPNQKKLPQSEIYRIFQDSEGYMWYATQGAGLCRDNGYQVDIFRSDRDHPDMLRNNVVTSIAENEAQNEIWFGTKQGAYILKKSDFSIHPLPEATTNVRDIKLAANGTMWVIINQMVKVFSPQGEKTDSFALSWKGKPISAETVTLDSQGKLWILQWNGGIQYIDTRTLQLSTMNWEVPFSPTSLAEDITNQQFFVGTWGAGIYLYDGINATPVATDLNTLTERQIRSVHYDRWRKMLWVVTMAGLFAYDVQENGALKPHPTAALNMAAQQAIYQLCFDNRGNIWVPGTTPLSFILCPIMGKPRQFISFEELTKRIGMRVPVGAFQNEGTYCWIWSDRTQLLLFDQQTGRVTLANGTFGEETNRFGNVMAKRKKGGIWCSSGRELYISTHQDMNITLQHKMTLPSPISTLSEGSDGRVFIGTTESLFSYDETNGALRKIAGDVQTVRDIVTSKEGDIYFISVAKGLCKSDGKKGYEVLAPYNRFTALNFCRKNILWVANALGDVWKLKDNKLVYMSVASSKMSNGVKQIRCDSLNHIWVMGDTYLIEYFPESDRRRLYRCGIDGIQLTNFGALSITDDEKILVAGGGGLLVFEPRKADISEAPTPAVAAYSIDGEKHLLSASCNDIDIPSEAVTLELELTDFNYLKASEVQFAYRLNGLSDQWLELPFGENKMRIVNLSKGDYSLELRVYDRFAHWNDPVTVLNIHRQPAWYETWWAYLCYFIIFALLITKGAQYYQKRNKSKTQHEMDTKLTEMKLRFFTNISHELRTPLSLIITPLESIIKRNEEKGNEGEESASQKELKGILKHANELLDLVNRLLDFRKMDMGEMQIRPSTGDLFEFMRSCVASFQTLAEKNNINLISTIPNDTLICDFDWKAMHHVMYNLLSNSMKYTEEGSIEVKVTREEDIVEVTVEDTGTGIPEEGLPHIFDPYFQASNAENNPHAGTGIGLSMVKELVTAMNGTISVESKLGKGTSFKVSLPIIASENSNDELTGSPVIPKLPSVLIADDNDDFRDFLVQELQNDYNILQARNGREALKLAQTHYVDVILSDIMMPQMDGNELCKQLKQDESTSHIFIMLMTAKTADEGMLKSYEAGADFYLPKPFSMDLLRNRLQHMTKMQERRIMLLSKAESKEVVTESEEELRISPIDRKFMEKMKETMERHVADTTFSVDTFCADMAMSRMNFYRKMHALTGQTPAQYINDFRLALADKLLREGELNVSEVADRTGFSTASYFSKCYKAKFGIAPKEVRQK